VVASFRLAAALYWAYACRQVPYCAKRLCARDISSPAVYSPSDPDWQNAIKADCVVPGPRRCQSERDVSNGNKTPSRCESAAWNTHATLVISIMSCRLQTTVSLAWHDQPYYVQVATTDPTTVAYDITAAPVTPRLASPGPCSRNTTCTTLSPHLTDDERLDTDPQSIPGPASLPSGALLVMLDGDTKFRLPNVISLAIYPPRRRLKDSLNCQPRGVWRHPSALVGVGAYSLKLD
jgi:hypothetical protein